jgi:ligand-binding SRPBCC domain-containing protein
LLYTIHSQQLIKAPLDRVWSFMSDPRNLATITPGYMKFTVLSEPEEKVFPGQIIEYYVSPVLGIRLHWVTEITQVKDKEYFIDEQRFGPYAFWHHKHFLKETPEGTLMTDIVHYKLPLGFLGKIAHGLFVKKQLQKIFDFRRVKLEEIFK